MSQLSISNVSVKVPNIFTVNLAFKPQGSDVAAVQVDLAIPVGTKFDSVVIGPVVTAAQKSLSSNVLNGSTIRILVFGLNQTTLAAGVIATYTFIAQAPQTEVFNLSNASASDPIGTAVPITTAGGNLTITPEDQNVATTLQQLQTDLTAAQTALTDTQTSMTAAQSEVAALIPLANPDVTAQDQVVQALTSGLSGLKSALDTLASNIKAVTGQ